jgi:hypothetical protein
MELKISQQILENYTDIKFHENPSSGSRIVPWGRTDGWIDRQTDIKQLIVAFSNFATAPLKFFKEI